MLATDGTVNTAQHLALDNWQAIAHYDPAELTRLLQHCHDWEEHTDPGGQRFPRAKQHDDKTIASALIPLTPLTVDPPTP